METLMRVDRIGRTDQTLRQHLREATAAMHDRLDAAMQPPSNWRSGPQYAHFLSSQYQARIAVETWLAMHAPAQLKPPEQSPLLAHDLGRLGEAIPPSRFQFALKYEGIATVIGAAWVLAGSSLGNRAMLHDMRRTLPDDAMWPAAFLGGTQMTQFWQNLRPLIEAPAPPDEQEIAVRAATQAFEHFLTVAETTRDLNTMEMAQ